MQRKEILLCRVMSETPITKDEFKDEKIDAAWYADQDYHKMYIAEITDILARQKELRTMHGTERR